MFLHTMFDVIKKITRQTRKNKNGLTNWGLLKDAAISRDDSDGGAVRVPN